MPVPISGHCQECGLCAVKYDSMPDGGEEQLARIIRKNVEEALAARGLAGTKKDLVPVAISVRHIHISGEDLNATFGPGYKLTILRDLSQPGQFAAKETVTLVGPNNEVIRNVRVLGPVRKATQVELSRTEGVVLGLPLPVRDSGDTAGSCPITLVGPAGSVYLREGAIKAKRHIHMTPKGAESFGLKDKDLVSAEYIGKAGLVFSKVLVRVSDKFKLEMHLDTDEGNASDISCGSHVRIIK